MLVLGIESSCDETSCAIVEDVFSVRANVVASQSIHTSYGGVVPELASREHLSTFPKILQECLKESQIKTKDIDLVAVTSGPGLIGSLAVGINFAKGVATALKKPLLGVNHIEAHIHAAYISNPDLVSFPALGVVISGAHTLLLLLQSPVDFFFIGQSRDDAIGETFDKVAVLMGLPYPGGAHIEALAKDGDPEAYPFSEGKVPGYEFSFSGLKTASMYALKGNNSTRFSPNKSLSHQELANIAASFQRAAFSSLLKKIPLAIEQWKCKSLLIGGGVCHNQYFRNLLQTHLEIPTAFPLPSLCSDNAAMVASLGNQIFIANRTKTIISNKQESIVPCTRSSWPLAK